MYNKVTFEEWKNECSEKLKTFEILSEFKGSSKKMKFKCLICGHIFECTPYDFKRHKTRLCKMCDSNNRRRTQEDFLNEVKEKNKHFDDIIIGEYKSKREKIEVKCKKCGLTHYYLPISLISGCWCPKCKGSRLKKEDEFLSDLYNRHGNLITIESQYINDSTKMLFKCNKCGHIWSAKPRTILNGHGCPKCKIKHLERDIDLLLKYENVEFQKTFEWLKDKSNMYIDFYLPDKKIAIECQGEQHFKPIDFAGKGEIWANENFQDTLRRDKLKKELCEKNGVKILYYTTENIKNKNYNSDEEYDLIYNEKNLITDLETLKLLIE